MTIGELIKITDEFFKSNQTDQKKNWNYVGESISILGKYDNELDKLVRGRTGGSFYELQIVIPKKILNKMTSEDIINLFKFTDEHRILGYGKMTGTNMGYFDIGASFLKSNTTRDFWGTVYGHRKIRALILTIFTLAPIRLTKETDQKPISIY